MWQCAARKEGHALQAAQHGRQRAGGMVWAGLGARKSRRASALQIACPPSEGPSSTPSNCPGCAPCLPHCPRLLRRHFGCLLLPIQHHIRPHTRPPRCPAGCATPLPSLRHTGPSAFKDREPQLPPACMPSQPCSLALRGFLNEVRQQGRCAVSYALACLLPFEHPALMLPAPLACPPPRRQQAGSYGPPDGPILPAQPAA